MHHYLYFVSVMFADHSATYAEKWSNRPHLVSCCGSYHVGNENEEFQSSSDIFTNWKQWVLGPTKVEKYGSSVEFMGPLP